MQELSILAAVAQIQETAKVLVLKVSQDLVVLVLLAAPSFEQSSVSPVELSRLPCYVFFFLYVGDQLPGELSRS